MNELKFPDIATSTSAIRSQFNAWHRIKENFSDLLNRWKEVSEHLELKDFAISDEPEKFGKGVAYGKAYKVYLRSTVLDGKIQGKVSVVMTEPLLGDPFIVTEFILTPNDVYLFLSGEPIFSAGDREASYRLVCEAIFRVIES